MFAHCPILYMIPIPGKWKWGALAVRESLEGSLGRGAYAYIGLYVSIQL